MANGFNQSYATVHGVAVSNEDPMGLQLRFDEQEADPSRQGRDGVFMRHRHEGNGSVPLPRQDSVGRPLSQDLDVQAQKHLAILRKEQDKELNELTGTNPGQAGGAIRVKFGVECGSALVLQIQRSFAVTTTIAELKKMLEFQMKIPAYFQAWYFRGQELRNSDTLGGRNIQDNSVIQVAVLAFVRE